MFKIYKPLLLILMGIFFMTVIPLESAIFPTDDAKPIHEAFISKFADPTVYIIIPKEPPASIKEQIPAKPSNEVIWIPGYWAWSEANNDFVWICGIWRHPPPNHPYWITGSWISQPDGWVWMRGFWSTIPPEQLTFIEKAPPNSIDDQVPVSKGANYFWIPGYWEYSSISKNYTWLSGKWELLNENWILNPASYIWSPDGYVFIPLYWDWPLEKRGYAYKCSAPGIGAPSIMAPQMIIQELFMFYPDYITLFCYCWHFYPEWWEGCGCIPPWWGWDNWWAFGWEDMWGLWWWWGHPGFLPPSWITLELSLEISPPPLVIINAFKTIPKPPFPIVQGNQPLLPKGPSGIKDVPKPHVPNNVRPGGQLTPPHLPSRQVAPPLSPPQKPHIITPPSQQQTHPITPSYPQPIYPPQSHQPPLRHLPHSNQPPSYYPPRHPQYPQQPPTRPIYPVNPQTPHQPPQRITPPSSTRPQLPSQKHSNIHQNRQSDYNRNNKK